MKSARSYFLAFFMVIALPGGACSRKAPPVTPQPSPPTDWRIAEERFDKREYAAAAEAYKRFLGSGPPDADRAETALFRLGLLHALPDSPLYDPERASRLFLQVSETHPNGPHSEEVKLILNLLERIDDAREAVPEPVIPPAGPPVEWQIAEGRFARQEYAAAADAYEKFLRGRPDSDRAETALFRLGLLYALPDSPVQDLEKASLLFSEILETHPHSRHSGEAQLIVHLLGLIDDAGKIVSQKEKRIRELSNELDKIKAIDLKKRAPKPD